MILIPQFEITASLGKDIISTVFPEALQAAAKINLSTPTMGPSRGTLEGVLGLTRLQFEVEIKAEIKTQRPTSKIGSHPAAYLAQVFT